MMCVTSIAQAISHAYVNHRRRDVAWAAGLATALALAALLAVPADPTGVVKAAPPDLFSTRGSGVLVRDIAEPALAPERVRAWTGVPRA